MLIESDSVQVIREWVQRAALRRRKEMKKVRVMIATFCLLITLAVIGIVDRHILVFAESKYRSPYPLAPRCDCMRDGRHGALYQGGCFFSECWIRLD